LSLIKYLLTERIIDGNKVIIILTEKRRNETIIMPYWPSSCSGRHPLFCFPGQDEKLDENDPGGAGLSIEGHRLYFHVRRPINYLPLSPIKFLTLFNILYKLRLSKCQARLIKRMK